MERSRGVVRYKKHVTQAHLPVELYASGIIGVINAGDSRAGSWACSRQAFPQPVGSRSPMKTS